MTLCFEVLLLHGNRLEFWNMEHRIYRVLIIEDSREDRELLERSLESYGFFRVVDCLSNGFTAPALIQKVQPDLLFLDVELPGIQGHAVIEKLRGKITWNMKIIFYTAHPQYMIDAIRISAFDYLLKPFEKKDLDLIINRFLQVCIEEKKELGGHLPLQGDSGEAGKKTFAIQLPTGDIHILQLSDIGYFKFNASRRCWEVFLYTQKLLAMRSSINATRILSFSPQFVQIHKSYIVNLQHLAVIHADVCIMFPPFNSEKLPISGKYKKELQNSFIQF